MQEKALNNILNNKIIHERARLLILTYLASSEKESVPFNELKQALNLTAGNLSVQLKTLFEAGYINITKEFKNNKPLTKAYITKKGREELKKYLESIDNIVKIIKIR
jgi:DNA-binding HxlR family transcriptional regulator